MPASPADALTVSREYVDQADFYLGIFAFRYGFVPEGQQKSVIELEYDRAIERGIPVLIFIADETAHSVNRRRRNGRWRAETEGAESPRPRPREQITYSRARTERGGAGVRSRRAQRAEDSKPLDANCSNSTCSSSSQAPSPARAGICSSTRRAQPHVTSSKVRSHSRWTRVSIPPHDSCCLSRITSTHQRTLRCADPAIVPVSRQAIFR